MFRRFYKQAQSTTRCENPNIEKVSSDFKLFSYVSDIKMVHLSFERFGTIFITKIEKPYLVLQLQVHR